MSKISARSRRAGAVLAAASLATLAFTGAAAAGSANAASSGFDPYSPAYGHPYRQGVVPAIGTLQKMNHYASTNSSVTAATGPGTGPQTLSYGGGNDGIGVQSGHSKVYLVFFGTQWGTSSTDANGNLKFTGDANGAAGVAQQMFKGIGTNNELWSADLTQWCQGNANAYLATGATACPTTSGASYIPYQSGGVLAGVWYDNSVVSPSTATQAQLSQEAVNAAAHFGNTTGVSNLYAYYVIASPPGTDPDNYQENHFCAWHSWASSSYGAIAYSNQPYNMEYGGSGGGCGVGFVNSPGTTDGYTITLGHEWHETMSDPTPYGGWSNHVSGSSYNGEENSDECAWISPGQPGGAADVSFGSFGTYAEQASWSNDTNSCAISHPILTHSEVLGCAWQGLPWMANNCGYGDGQITFSPQGLSGSYSYSWTVGAGSIVSGCTAASTSCTLDVEQPTYGNVTTTVYLNLTQAGASWSISATARTSSTTGCTNPKLCYS